MARAQTTAQRSAPAAATPVLPPTVGARAEKHRFLLRGGATALASVEARGDMLELTVTVPAESLPDGTKPMLQW